MTNIETIKAAIENAEAKLAYYASDEYHELFLPGRVSYPEVSIAVAEKQLARAKAELAEAL